MPEVSFTSVVIVSVYVLLLAIKSLEGLKVNVMLSLVVGSPEVICRQVLMPTSRTQIVFMVTVLGSIASRNVIVMFESTGKFCSGRLVLFLPVVGATDSVIFRLVMLSLIIVEFDMFELSIVEFEIDELSIIELQIVELSILEEFIVEGHESELIIVELSRIVELSIVELSIVELSTVE